MDAQDGWRWTFYNTRVNQSNFFKVYAKRMQNLTGSTIKYLRTVGGGEYYCNEFKEYCEEFGIQHEWTTPHTPQLNPRAERLNRTLEESATVLLLQSQLPKK
jgi:hypothetical protein